MPTTWFGGRTGTEITAARLNDLEGRATTGAGAATTAAAAATTATAAQTAASAASAAVAAKVDKGALVLNVKDSPFNAIGDGVHDDTTNIQAAIDAAIGGPPSGAITQDRFAVAAVYLPPGKYKITAPLKIYGVFGFHMYGVNTGTILAASGNLSSVLDLNGVRHSTFERFQIWSLTVNVDTATDGIAINWTTAVSVGSTYKNAFYNIFILGLKYVRGFGVGCLSGTGDVSHQSFYSCSAQGSWTPGETTWWQGGFVSGSGASANVLDHFYYACRSVSNSIGFFANGTDMSLLGAASSLNGTDIFHVGTRSVTVIGFRSEAAQRLYVQGGAGASYTTQVTLQGIRWAYVGTTIPDGAFIQLKYGGLASFINVQGVLSGTEVYPLVVDITAPRNVSLTINGMSTTTPLDSLFTGVGLGSRIVTSYQRVNTLGQVIDNVPFWTANVGAFVNTQVPTFADGLNVGAAGVAAIMPSGAGSPEGAVTASPGSMYLRSSSAGVGSLHVKGSGTGNTGWLLVTTGAEPGPTTVVTDNFNRADSTAGLGTATTGQVWTLATGTFGISSNQAYSPSHAGLERTYLAAGASDVIITAKVAASTSGNGMGLLGRVVTNGTGPGFLTAVGTDQLGLITIDSTTSTRIGSAISPAVAAGDTVRLVLAGSAVSMLVDYGTTGTFVLKASATSTLNQTATNHGLRSGSNSDGSNRFDDFVIQTPA